MIKRWVLILLIIFCLLSAPVLAAKGIRILINGQEVAADLIIQDGRIYVPLRFVSDYLGHSVNWDITTQTVSINNPDNTSLNINQITYDKEYYLQRITDAIVDLEESRIFIKDLITGNYIISQENGLTNQTIEGIIKGLAQIFPQNHDGITGGDLQQEAGIEMEKNYEGQLDIKQYVKENEKLFSDFLLLVDSTIEHGEELKRNIISSDLTITEIRNLSNNFQLLAKELNIRY